MSDAWTYSTSGALSFACFILMCALPMLLTLTCWSVARDYAKAKAYGHMCLSLVFTFIVAVVTVALMRLYAFQFLGVA